MSGGDRRSGSGGRKMIGGTGPLQRMKPLDGGPAASEELEPRGWLLTWSVAG